MKTALALGLVLLACALSGCTISQVEVSSQSADLAAAETTNAR